MSVTGEPGGSPVKSGIPLTDLGAALFAVVGILAALEHRHKTGAGQHVDTSLLDAGVGLSVWEATQYFSGRGIPERLGSAHRMSAPYQAFRCADGFITIGGANDRSFRRICEVLENPEWLDAPAFKTDEVRIRNRANMAAKIEGLPRHFAPTGCALFDANSIPWADRQHAQVFQDPQVLAREMVVDISIRRWSIRALGSPIKMSATPPTCGDARRSASTRRILGDGIRGGGGIRGSWKRNNDPRSSLAWNRRERFAGEQIERGQDAAGLVRHAGQRQPHLDAAERACERQIVEIPEVADAEDLPLQLPEPGAERHVEPIEHDRAEGVRVAPLWHDHRRQDAAVPAGFWATCRGPTPSPRRASRAEAS
jgi:hypothetical protein